MNFWLKFKAKLVGAAAITLSVVAVILRMKWLKIQRDRFKRDADTYKAQAKQAKKIVVADAEIENEFSDLEREAEKDLDDDKMPDNIRDRNKW